MIHVTDTGRLEVNSFRYLRAYVLQYLCIQPFELNDLIDVIRKNHHEYKYTKPAVMIDTIADMAKQQLIKVDLQ